MRSLIQGRGQHTHIQYIHTPHLTTWYNFITYRILARGAVAGAGIEWWVSLYIFCYTLINDFCSIARWPVSPGGKQLNYYSTAVQHNNSSVTPFFLVERFPYKAAKKKGKTVHTTQHVHHVFMKRKRKQQKAEPLLIDANKQYRYTAQTVLFAFEIGSSYSSDWRAICCMYVPCISARFCLINSGCLENHRGERQPPSKAKVYPVPRRNKDRNTINIDHTSSAIFNHDHINFPYTLKFQAQQKTGAVHWQTNKKGALRTTPNTINSPGRR